MASLKSEIQGLQSSHDREMASLTAAYEESQHALKSALAKIADLEIVNRTRMIEMEATKAEAETQYLHTLTGIRVASLEKILLRMQRRHTSGAFAAWLTRTQKARQLKAAATRVVGRLASSCVVGAYGRWVEYWAQMAHFKRIGARLQNLAASRTLSTWVEVVRMWQAEREAAEHEKAMKLLRTQMQEMLSAHEAMVTSETQLNAAEKRNTEARHQAALLALRSTGLQKIVLRIRHRSIAAVPRAMAWRAGAGRHDRRRPGWRGGICI